MERFFDNLDIAKILDSGARAFLEGYSVYCVQVVVDSVELFAIFYSFVELLEEASALLGHYRVVAFEGYTRIEALNNCWNT